MSLQPGSTVRLYYHLSTQYGANISSFRTNYCVKLWQRNAQNFSIIIMIIPLGYYSAPTNSKVHRPSWEPNRSSGQEIPHILWNTKVHYSVHNSPPLSPIHSQINPAHPLPSMFIFTLPFAPRSSKWSFALTQVYRPRPLYAPLLSPVSHDMPSWLVYSDNTSVHRYL